MVSSILSLIAHCMANLFRHSSPGKENFVLWHGETGLLVAQEKFFLFWTDAVHRNLQYFMQKSNPQAYALLEAQSQQCANAVL